MDENKEIENKEIENKEIENKEIENKEIENKEIAIEENLEKIDEEQKLEEEKENPFKDPDFYKGFFGSLMLFLVLGAISGGALWLLGIVPYLIISVVIYSLINNNNSSLALGILLAGLVPFVGTFLLMGGCIIFFM